VAVAAAERERLLEERRLAHAKRQVTALVLLQCAVRLEHLYTAATPLYNDAATVTRVSVCGCFGSFAVMLVCVYSV
jgi:hypothetical protein